MILVLFEPLMMINVNLKCKQSILWHWFYNFFFFWDICNAQCILFILFYLIKHQEIDSIIWCTYFYEVLKKYDLHLRFFLMINNYDFCTFYIN
jgi:hypothetical protein